MRRVKVLLHRPELAQRLGQLPLFKHLDAAARNLGILEDFGKSGPVPRHKLDDGPLAIVGENESISANAGLLRSQPLLTTQGPSLLPRASAAERRPRCISGGAGR